MSEHAKDHSPELPQPPGAPLAGGQDTPPPAVPVDSVGTQLARRRQELGWTIEHVAGRLNLAPRQIDALEADNLSALPGLASTRGFVRAYAKLLRMDAAPLVAALTQDAGPQEEAIPLRRPISSAPFAPAKLAPMHRSGGGKRLWGLILLALVVAVLAGAWRAGMFEFSPDGLAMTGKPPASDAVDGKAAAPSVSATAPEGAPAADTGSGAMPTDSAGGPAAASAVGASPAAATSPAESPAAVTSSAASPAAANAAAATPSSAGPAAANPPGAAAANATAPANAAPATAAANAAGPVKASSQSALLIKVREECWIEIRRGDKSVTRTLQPGAVETVEVGTGVTVVLGNALGVDVSLNGKPLDVRSRARNNVTRLDLKSS